MEEKFINYEKTIKRKHSINFTPTYTEEFKTYLNNTLFINIAEKTFEKLQWDVIFKDENNVKAIRKTTSFGVEQWTESISIKHDYGSVIVQSKSLGNEIWDIGRNSKRVKLFIFAFEETLKEFDKESLKIMEIETRRRNKWDDYIIPESLPQPKSSKIGNLTMPIIGVFIISILIGALEAYITLKGMYIFFLIEFLIAIAIAFIMKHLIIYLNYTDLKKLQYLILAIIILLFVSNKYFQYEILLYDNNSVSIGFREFIKLKFKKGLTIYKVNTGWIGLLTFWVLQIVIIYLITYLKVTSKLVSYAIERVPKEVVNFAYYHLVKEKSEVEVRKELTSKGWSNTKNQNEVFDALKGLHFTHDYYRNL